MSDTQTVWPEAQGGIARSTVPMGNPLGMPNSVFMQDEDSTYQDLGGSVDHWIMPDAMAGSEYPGFFVSGGSMQIYSGFWNTLINRFRDYFFRQPDAKNRVYYTTIKTRYAGRLQPTVKFDEVADYNNA